MNAFHEFEIVTILHASLCKHIYTRLTNKHARFDTHIEIRSLFPIRVSYANFAFQTTTYNRSFIGFRLLTRICAVNTNSLQLGSDECDFQLEPAGVLRAIALMHGVIRRFALIETNWGHEGELVILITVDV